MSEIEMTREQILDYVESLPDDITPDTEIDLAEVSGSSEVAEEGEEQPSEEQSESEETEVEASADDDAAVEDEQSESEPEPELSLDEKLEQIAMRQQRQIDKLAGNYGSFRQDILDAVRELKEERQKSDDDAFEALDEPTPRRQAPPVEESPQLEVQKYQSAAAEEMARMYKDLPDDDKKFVADNADVFREVFSAHEADLVKDVERDGLTPRQFARGAGRAYQYALEDARARVKKEQGKAHREKVVADTQESNKKRKRAAAVSQGEQPAESPLPSFEDRVNTAAADPSVSKEQLKRLIAEGLPD